MRLTKAVTPKATAKAKAMASGGEGDGQESAFMPQSPMRPATKRKRVAFNLQGNQVSLAALATPATTTMTARYV